jgi:hypothetical protein
MSSSFACFGTKTKHSTNKQKPIAVLQDGLGGLTPSEVADRLLAETRDNAATFGFRVLAAQPPPAPDGGSSSSSGGTGSGSGNDGNGSGTILDSSSSSAASTNGGTPSTNPSSSSAAVLEVEYVHQLCRGVVSEGAGGLRRCLATTGDKELQVVSRHYVSALAVRDGSAYVVKASAPSETWPDVAPLLLASVRSFAP